MRKIDSNVLSELPGEAKALIRTGVYSLYTLTIEDAEYVLVTNSGERYFLDACGSLVSGVHVDDLKGVIGDVVAFDDPSTDGAVVNCV